VIKVKHQMVDYLDFEALKSGASVPFLLFNPLDAADVDMYPLTG